MRARIAREWLQKHPTPRAADGDFHWYPGAFDAGALAAEAGGELTVWLAPGRVACARRFHDVAPADGRRYAGLAVVIASARDMSAAALLGAASIPVAAPWAGQGTSDDAIVVEPAPLSPAASPSTALVAAAWRGGTAPMIAADLATLAAIDTWLPDDVRRAPRRIVFEPAAPSVPATAPAARDSACAWLAAAIGARGAALDRARDAWRMVGALAAVEGKTLGETFELLGALDRAWSSAPALREHLAAAGIAVPARAHAADAATQWTRVLHAWGRGWLAPTTRDALAALIVQRAVADQLAAHAPDGWRRALRWESLLPHAAAEDLERRALTRLPTLAEVRHG
jgi:hypothetical protein